MKDGVLFGKVLGLLLASHQAHELGYKKISVIEFGCWNCEGLIDLENYIDDIEFNKGSKGEIILIGDSHADTLSNELNNAAQENDFSLNDLKSFLSLIKKLDLN